MEELLRNKRLVAAHRKLIDIQGQKVAEINAGIASCDDQRVRALGKLEAFGDSALFKPGNISKSLRDLSARKVQLEKDLAAAEREQAKLEIIIERLKEKQVELAQSVADEEMAESIEEWTNLDFAQEIEAPRRSSRV